MHKLKQYLLPEHLNEFLKKVNEIHTYNTRASNDFYISNDDTNPNFSWGLKL